MSDTQLNNMIGTGDAGQRQTILARRIVVLIVYLVGSAIATQYFAHTYQYSPILGLNYGGWYFPGMIVYWASKWWGHYYSDFSVSISFGGLFTSITLIIYLHIERMTQQRAKGNKYMHGSAHWASEKEIRESGVLPRIPTFWRKLWRKLRFWIPGKTPKSDGVYVGAWQDEVGVTHYLRDSGPSHVMCFAPTRSGKGVGLVIPTLLSWPHSVIVADLKGELYDNTAGWRKDYAGNKIIRFEPGNPEGSARWNPFDEIRVGTEHETADVSALSMIIVDPNGKGIEDHWGRTAEDFLSGCITHLLYKREREGTPANMGALNRMLANPDLPLDELYKEMITYSHMKDGSVHPVASGAAQKMLDKPENERGSVVSTAQSFLTIYRDPVLVKNLATSDFKLTDLMNHDDPVSLYLITTPDNMERLRPILRIMINWFIQKHTSRSSLKSWFGRSVMAHKHRILMMMDEFPSFGKLPAIAGGLAFVAGYGIKCYLITQDLTQLYQHYTKEESVTSNCHIQIAFPPNRVETAEYLSKLCGETTVVEETFSESGKKAAPTMGQISKSVTMTKRPLLTADEALHLTGPKKDEDGNILAPGEMIVHVSGYAPIRGKQPLYFNDPVFLARSRVKAPESSDILTINKFASKPAEKASL